LPGYKEFCDKCYVARYGALAAPQDGFRENWTIYIYLPFWILVSYMFVTYMPAPATVGVLLVALAIIWYLFWGTYSKRPRKRYRTPQETVCLVLGLSCGVVWKITDAEVWARLGIACVFVGGGYRAFYRAIDRIKMAAGGQGPGEH
jgi:hypothetical protein